MDAFINHVNNALQLATYQSIPLAMQTQLIAATAMPSTASIGFSSIYGKGKQEGRRGGKPHLVP